MAQEKVVTVDAVVAVVADVVVVGVVAILVLVVVVVLVGGTELVLEELSWVEVESAVVEVETGAVVV